MHEEEAGLARRASACSRHDLLQEEYDLSLLLFCSHGPLTLLAGRSSEGLIVSVVVDLSQRGSTRYFTPSSERRSWELQHLKT